MGMFLSVWTTLASLLGVASGCQGCVDTTDEAIVHRRGDGQEESVRWDDLVAVTILTTSDGPWSEDVFWLLQGTGSGCLVPQGARGSAALLEVLGKRLPDFDPMQVIQAMGCTSEASFPCWRRPEASAQ